MLEASRRRCNPPADDGLRSWNLCCRFRVRIQVVAGHRRKIPMANITPEKIIKDEMRLSAIEFLLCKLTATIVVASSKTERELDLWRTEMKVTLQKQTFSALDPTLSDVAAQELEEAVDALLGLLKKHMASLKGGGLRQ